MENFHPTVTVTELKLCSFLINVIDKKSCLKIRQIGNDEKIK